MAKLFYDHLIVIEEITEVVGNDTKALALIDEALQNEILDEIFTHLPREHHEEFLTKFHATPHDRSLIGYLNTHAGKNMEVVLLKRANKAKKRLLALLAKLPRS